MPAPLRNFEISLFTSASSLPSAVLDFFRANQHISNVVYPHVLKCLESEKRGKTDPRQFWIVSSSRCVSNNESAIDFVLAATEGLLGAYPIFIVHSKLPRTNLDYYLKPRLMGLAKALSGALEQNGDSPARVFSVFAVQPVTVMFASIWTEITGIQLALNGKTDISQYYTALLTYCDAKTLKYGRAADARERTSSSRLAHITDWPSVAQLCHGFASTSDPFTLTMAKAEEEAKFLIQRGLVWVHEVEGRTGASEIASLCAVTRTSEDVAAITKVYTSTEHRGRGCAESLVRAVCNYYLKSSSPGKSTMILYVAHDNPGARKVYAKVGFVGLEDFSNHEELVEAWLELGFDQNRVSLGHW